MEAQANGDREGFGRLPDLILLDGGIGQVHAVQPVLETFGLAVPLFGMVKDSKHRTRAISSTGGELALTATRQAFALVTTIQDETHRFAVAYHHKKHTASAFTSELEKIPGIGKTRREALLKAFKNVKALSAADETQLALVPGMNKTAAKAVKDYFSKAE
jgi:excinuclease ABC subunit C